jgi:hypothetical protein
MPWFPSTVIPDVYISTYWLKNEENDIHVNQKRLSYFLFKTYALDPFDELPIVDYSCAAHSVNLNSLP